MNSTRRGPLSATPSELHRSHTSDSSSTSSTAALQRHQHQRPAVAHSCLAAWKYFILVLENTTAHGFNHLVAIGRHWSERFTWFLLLVAAAFGALMLCLSTYGRYETSPVVTSLDFNYLDIRVMPPAVYICPDETSEPKLVIAAAQRLAERGYAGGNVSHLILFVEALANASSYKGLHYMEPFAEDTNLPPSFTFINIFREVKFVSKPKNIIAKHPAQETLTEVGLCYADNSLIAHWTSPNFGDSDKSFQPPEVSDMLKPIQPIATFTNIISSYRLYVHDEYAVPSAGRPSAIVSLATNLEMQMRAQQTMASKAVMALKRKQRGCSALNEPTDGSPRPIYSLSSCLEACRVRFAQSLCGCRPYFLNYTKIPICDNSGMACLSKHSESILFLQYPGGNKHVECDCLPACEGYSYEVMGLRENQGSDLFGTTFVLMLKENIRIRIKRDVMFSVIDLFVSFGGAVGLCLGTSVLTIVEFIYFFSLRLLCMLCR